MVHNEYTQMDESMEVVPIVAPNEATAIKLLWQLHGKQLAMFFGLPLKWYEEEDNTNKLSTSSFSFLERILQFDELVTVWANKFYIDENIHESGV